MPAKVKGPTDHVVVVGAGLAGLSAALRLAGAGRKVTVVERESVPGGRNGLLEKDGYSFDTGPSVLTMPSLIQDAFSCVGEDMKDWLELSPLKPLRWKKRSVAQLAPKKPLAIAVT
jgi:phytoene desaturase